MNIGSNELEGPVEPMYPHPDLIDVENDIENIIGIKPIPTYNDMIKFLGENETDPKAIQLFKLYLTM